MPHNTVIIDSFAHYTTGTALTKKWDNTGTDNVVLSSGGRFGNAGVQITGFGGGINRASAVSSAPAKWSIAFGFKMNGELSGGTLVFFKLVDQPTIGSEWVQCTIKIQPGGRLAVLQNDGTLVGESTYSVHTGVWYHIEILVNCTVTGQADILINSVNILSVGGDFEQSVTLTGVNQVRINTQPSGNDLYVCDLRMAEGTDVGVGDARIVLLKPNADGSFTEWTTSTGTVHYTLVDEVPIDNNDWVESDTPGKRELFAAEDTIGTYDEIDDVQTVHWVEVLGTGTAKHYVNSVEGGVIDSVGKFDLGMWLVEPGSGTNWSQANVDAAEFGAKIT